MKNMKLIMENFNKFLKEEEEKEQSDEKLKFTLSKLDDEGRLISVGSLGSLKYTTEGGEEFEIGMLAGEGDVGVFLFFF